MHYVRAEEIDTPDGALRISDGLTTGVDLYFEVIPRVGETIWLTQFGAHLEFVVDKVVHNPKTSPKELKRKRSAPIYVQIRRTFDANVKDD